MSGVDVFGRYLLGRNQSVRGLPGYGYKRTSEGDYDIDKKRLCNIANPIQDNDATTLNIVHKIVEDSYLSVKADLKNVHNSLATLIQNHEGKITKNIYDFESVKKLLDATVNRLDKTEKLSDEISAVLHLHGL